MSIFRTLTVVSIILALIASPASAWSFRSYDTTISESRVLMGTTVSITVSVSGSLGRKVIENAVDKAFDEMSRIEGVFSVYIDTNEVSRINRLGRDVPMRISDEAFGLIAVSKEYFRRTEGAFDITVKPLMELWGFGSGNMRVPTEVEIQGALERVGSDKMVLNEADRTITFRADGMKIDLGGIAAGYAVDRAVGVLKSSGIKSAVVNAGGDIYCLGRKSKKRLWKTGVTHPRKKDKVFFEMHLENRAITTSGDYEKFFEAGGKRYSHIFDPRTGYPVEEKVVSATVTADDVMTADILATALCVMGPEGLRTVEGIPGVDAIIVVKERKRLKVEMTKGLKAGYNAIESTL